MLALFAGRLLRKMTILSFVRNAGHPIIANAGKKKAAAVFLLFWGTTMLLYQKEFIDFSSVRIFPAYLFSVSMHGSLGAVLAAVCPSPGVKLFGAGVFLMMISDYILSVHKFKHGANWILRCNSASYFVGTLLAALSLSLPI